MKVIVINLSGPPWLWSVLLYTLAAAWSVSGVMQARLVYWRWRVEREKKRAEDLNKLPFGGSY